MGAIGGKLLEVVIALALISAAFLFVKGQVSDRVAAEADKATAVAGLNQAAQVNQANVAALALAQAQYDAAQAASSKAITAQRELAGRLSKLNGDLNALPSSQDGPVAPVLAAALRGLRGLGPAASGGDAVQNGGAHPAPVNAGLPGAAAPAR